MSNDLKPIPASLSALEYIFQNFEASDRIAILVRSRGRRDPDCKNYGIDSRVALAWIISPFPFFFR